MTEAELEKFLQKQIDSLWCEVRKVEQRCDARLQSYTASEEKATEILRQTHETELANLAQRLGTMNEFRAQLDRERGGYVTRIEMDNFRSERETKLESIRREVELQIEPLKAHCNLEAGEREATKTVKSEFKDTVARNMMIVAIVVSVVAIIIDFVK